MNKIRRFRSPTKRLRTFNSRVRAQNATIDGGAGQGGRQDRGGRYQTQRNSSHPLSRYGSSYLASREWGTLYYTEWSARKIIDIPVEDMLRNGWKYNGLNDQQAEDFTRYLKSIRFFQQLTRSLKMERLLGGAVILMGIRGEREDAAEPLKISTVDEGDLIFVNQVSRNYVHKVEYSLDIFDPKYNQIEYLYVRGQKIHRSRLLIFDGNPLSENERQDLGLYNLNQDGFGVSVLSPIWDDIVRATGTRQGAYHLVNMASILMLKANNARDLQLTRAGLANQEILETVAEQMSMYRAAVLDMKDGDITTLAASFGSVPELLLSFLQVLSAASDIPATRFLGQAPGGLNATGESDLENYYNMIDSRREDRLRPIIEQFIQVAGRSFFGPQMWESLNVSLEFPPLWNMSEKELADIRTADANTYGRLVDSGIIDGGTAVQELHDRGVLKEAYAVPDEPPPEQDLGEPLKILEGIQDARPA